MKKKSSAKKRARAAAGQATIEYVLLVGAAATIGLAFYSMFSPIVASSMASFSAVLEQELMNGDYAETFPEAAAGWEN